MKRIIAAAVLAGLATSPVVADCNKPIAPNIPDGKKATQEQMIASQKEVAAFRAATNSYLDCLKKAEDEAMSASNAVTARFNDQAGIFSAKNAPPRPRAAPSGMVNGPAVV